jgi:hypothetical protein
MSDAKDEFIEGVLARSLIADPSRAPPSVPGIRGGRY